LGCLLGLSMLCVCAFPGPSGPGAVVAAAPQGPAGQALQAAAAAYEQAAGVKVQVEVLSAAAYDDQVAAALLAGLDRYDLVLLPGDSLAYWAGFHVILPLRPAEDDAGQAVRALAPLLADPELAPWLPALEVAGQLYGLPTQPDADVLWYRADLLSAAGLAAPRTWDEVEQAALALHAPPDRYGVVTAGGPLDAGLDFAAVLAGFGGAGVSPAGQAQAASPAAVRALEWYTGLRRVAPPGTAQFTRSDTLQMLAAGRAGLGLATLSAAGRLQDCAASPAVCANGRPLLEWAWLPGEPAGLGRLSAWAFPRGSNRAAGAAAFVAWLGGEQGARAWASGGGWPAHRGVLAGLDQPARALGQAGRFSSAFPAVATVDQLWQAYHAAAHGAAAGEMSPEQALLQAQTQIERALRQAGYDDR